MNSPSKAPTTHDEYIAAWPEAVQVLLQAMRKTIHEAAPSATEDIRYAIPTFRLNNQNLVHFAAFKNHIGFYPAPQGLEAFKERLSAYKGSKGAVQFPLNKPLLLDLVADIVKYRVEEVSRKKP